MGYSQSVPVPFPHIQKDFQSLVVRMMREKMCVDSSRLSFIQLHAATIHQLVTNKLVNSTRHRRLLLGIKGVGKSFLMQNFCDVMREILTDSLIVVHLHVDCRCPTPVLEISNRLGCVGKSLKEITDILKSRNLFVFLVVDEFQVVFNEIYDKGLQFIREIFQLGSDDSGRYHCILSGNSELRRLVTAKMELTEAKCKGFVHYTKLDLNETKYQPETILPFLTMEGFKELWFFHSSTRARAEVDLELMYLRTGGLPGHVRELSRGGTFCDDGIDLRDSMQDANTKKTLFVLLEQIRNFCERDNSTDSEVFLWTNLFPLPMSMRDFNIGRLRDLADAGLIQMVGSFYEVRIGLYSPVMYLQLLEVSNKALTCMQLMSLKYPVGNLSELAEETTASLLIDCPAFWEGCNIELPTESTFGTVTLSPNANSSVNVTRQQLMRELYGNQRNCLGADFCYVESTGRVHRFQLKLGQKEILQEDFEAIKDTFATNAILAEAAYRNSSLDLNNSVKYLVTTRSYDPATVTSMEGIHVIGPRQLLDWNVWPAEVCALGKPFK